MSGWRPIETVPRDGTKVYLAHPKWDCAEIGRWDWYEGPNEDGTGGFCLWFLDRHDAGAMCDALLWPEEDWMPTHWMPLLYTDERPDDQT